MKFSVKYLAAVLVVAGVVVSASLMKDETTRADACTVSDTLVNSCRSWFGATVGGYPQVASNTNSQFAYGEKRLNNPVALTDPTSPTTLTNQYDVVHRYHSPTQTSFDNNETSYYNRDNTYLFINWKPDTNWANASGGNATVNARIDQMADSIKALGNKKLFFSIFAEPENDISSDNCTTNGNGAAAGSPSDYVNMWHNVRDRFNAKGVTNVVWTMNYMGFSNWDCLVPLLWPGNDYVDWITYDPYGGGTNSSSLFADSVTPFYNYLSQNSDTAHNYLSKPWGLSEHGAWANGGTTQAGAIDYWNQAKTAYENNTFPRLKMYLTFDTSTNGTSQVGMDFNGQASTDEQAAYNAFAASIFNTAPPVQPAITAVSPASGTLSGTPTFAISTNSIVSSVVMRVDDQWVATDSSAPWSLSLNTKNYKNGVHTIDFRAWSGGVYAEKSVTVTIKN